VMRDWDPASGVTFAGSRSGSEGYFSSLASADDGHASLVVVVAPDLEIWRLGAHRNRPVR
jgi:hypothetical protein